MTGCPVSQVPSSSRSPGRARPRAADNLQLAPEPPSGPTSAVYTFNAVLGVMAPILVAIFLGDRSHEVLDGWKTWLDQNNAAVMSVLFLIFGVVLIGQGIQGI